MGFREDFEKFRKPQEEQKASTVLLPSFDDVRTALKEVKIKPGPTISSIQEQEERNLLKIQEERDKKVLLSAPTGKETPLLPSFDFLKDKSTEKQGFKLSDFIIPEVRQGFSQSFGKAEQGTASDIYTEMIPSFGKKRAYEIADGYQKGVDSLGYPVGIQLTDSEKQQFDGWKQKHWAMLTLDATDFLGVGIAIKSGAGFLSRTGLRNAVSAATKQDNIKAIHAEILKQLPDLKGTKELEDVTEIVIAGREQNPDKLAQIVQKRVADTTRTPQASFATPAQKVVYENGLPILRTTTPDTLLERHKEALEALKGNREALRLSNADVLSEEIRAGVLSTKTTADDSVEVFRISPRGRRIRGGEEVSLSEDFARSVSEGVKPQKIEVPIADLIRLPDGTFTFAPERLIKESPELKFPTNIPKPIVEAAKKKEADVIAEKLAKEKAEQKAKREATAKAERELMRPVEEAKATLKKLQKKPVMVRVETQKRVAKENQLKTKELVGIKNTTIKKISEIDKKLRADKQKVSLSHVKRMQKATTKLQKQKEKIRYQNELAKLSEKAKKDKVGLKISERQSLTEIRKKSQTRISDIRKEGTKNLKEAEKALRGSRGEVSAIIKKATETVEDVKVAEKEIKAVKAPTRKVTKESLKPVGEGEVKESRLFESVQTRVREVRKELGENINSKDFEFYRVATNKDQIAKATKYIEANGVEKTIKDLEIAFRTGGDAAPNILNNSLMLALEPELLKAGMSKHADSLLRLSSRLATRFGQELQILSVLDRNNPLNVLKRLQDNLDSLVGDSDILGVPVNKGARTKAEKNLEKLVSTVDIKGNAKKVVDEIPICPVK